MQRCIFQPQMPQYVVIAPTASTIYKLINGKNALNLLFNNHLHFLDEFIRFSLYDINMQNTFDVSTKFHSFFPSVRMNHI